MLDIYKEIWLRVITDIHSCQLGHYTLGSLVPDYQSCPACDNEGGNAARKF